MTHLVPWLLREGIAGVLPLERQAGVDGHGLAPHNSRKLRMVGHFDKMVMNQGEAAIRARVRAACAAHAQRGFIPSVDHQTRRASRWTSTASSSDCSMSIRARPTSSLELRPRCHRLYPVAAHVCRYPPRFVPREGIGRRRTSDERKHPPGKPVAFGRGERWPAVATSVSIHRASRWHSGGRRSAGGSDERKHPPGEPVAFGREEWPAGSDERKHPPGKPVAFGQEGLAGGGSDERKHPPGKPVAFGRERMAGGSDERKHPPGKPAAFGRERIGRRLGRGGAASGLPSGV